MRALNVNLDQQLFTDRAAFEAAARAQADHVFGDRTELRDDHLRRMGVEPERAAPEVP